MSLMLLKALVGPAALLVIVVFLASLSLLLSRPLAILNDASLMEAWGAALAALAPRYGNIRLGAFYAYEAEAQLLAQHEASSHRPVGYASSPSLPGTLNTPWWTDFAHLIYWFYVVASFTTVVFLAYLYDFFARRRETAHPVRETRGFSRAQTGDLITAVLPLTWSATMVMHASTHSINFDENTAGTIFSFTVIAYQWGWNYYFPRDVVTQLEAAPKVVGRGRVVSFAPTPSEALASRAVDTWAMRSTVGSRHASRSGRLNTASPLGLVLPTDMVAGAAAAFGAAKSWRKVAAAALGESVPTYEPALSEARPITQASVGGVETTTAWAARPALFVAGEYLGLGQRHFGPVGATGAEPLTSLWVGSLGGGAALTAPVPMLRPALENLGASRGQGRALSPEALSPKKGLPLGGLRAPTAALKHQQLLWSGPDALTGAGFTCLASTEDAGWLTPVPAREALARATAALAPSCRSGNGPFAAANPAPLLFAFDLSSRALFGHAALASAGVSSLQLPFTWVGAGSALETEISEDSASLWRLAMAPDQALVALCGPVGAQGSNSPAKGLRLLAACAPAQQGLGAGLHYCEPSLAPEPATARLVVGPQCLRAPLNTNTAPARNYLPELAPTAETLTATLARLPRVPSSSHPTRPEALAAQIFSLKSFVVGITQSGVVAYIGEPADSPVTAPRRQPQPSPAGLGLDEVRLVRGGGSRLWDPAQVNAKPAPLATPQTTLPIGPIGLLGLAWSSTASLTSHPSFKCSRGGLWRRPMTGLRANTPALTGLKEGLNAPLLSKAGSVLGRPSLGLWALGGQSRPGVGSAADVALLRWSPTWAFFGPAPAEDLDPTFINTTWTPEINTTRRSDHNSRYKVTWSPLASALTTGAGLGGPVSGPLTRGALSPLGVRQSLLALYEGGLKNHSGLSGAKALLHNSPLAASGQRPEHGLVSLGWPALWSFAPSPSDNPAALVGAPASGSWASGRAASVLSASAGARSRGCLSPSLVGLSSGNSLVSLLAISAFTSSTGPDRVPGRAQGYLPLSSSLSSSRRLRVTKGVTLPSDAPMHVICGSKDVIHSWAIPGLGVKIDCIPGYNSHRRLLLRWRGAYWGQCMEVCGRYHHWMPIMVNVVHPALFADWCLTFLRGLDTQAHSGSSAPLAGTAAQLLQGLEAA